MKINKILGNFNVNKWIIKLFEFGKSLIKNNKIWLNKNNLFVVKFSKIKNWNNKKIKQENKIEKSFCKISIENNSFVKIIIKINEICK